MDNLLVFKSLLHLVNELKTEEDCRIHLQKIRWGDTLICSHCGSVNDDHYRLTAYGSFCGMYKCKDCRSRFTVRTGTMFEGSHIPLKKWFLGIYVFLSHKKGISSTQLHRDINVTQKTAWFMLHRIRCNCEDKIPVNFETSTQIDETYVGGKNRGRKKRTQGRSLTKVPVMGLLSDGKVRTKVIPNTSGRVLKSIIYDLIRKGSTIVTDGWVGYRGLGNDFVHKVIQHNTGIYVQDGYHTNSIEGFWSQLKRGIIGIYHLVSAKHLSKYCEEFAYRYNTRSMMDGERFAWFLSSADSRLRYYNLKHPYEFM